ncbi:hypothetical protein V6N13_139267 [Hibiscus sabdariffa]
MGCSCWPGSSSKISKERTNKNINKKDDSHNNETNPHAQIQASSDKLEASARGTVRKEEVANHEQLSMDVKKLNLDDEISKDGGESSKRAHSFTFEELTVATGNFQSRCFLGSGGFGKVYKGLLEKTYQVVAVKQLDHNGLQGIKEFAVEVLTLSMVEHPNLVKLIGFCAEGDQRLLVYEYMPLGSLENNLLNLQPDQKPLDWNTRMKIAAGAAKGLEYLHARPMFKERKNFSRMVDPLLQGQYPVRASQKYDPSNLVPSSQESMPSSSKNMYDDIEPVPEIVADLGGQEAGKNRSK